MTLELITAKADAGRPWFFLDTRFYLNQCLLKGVGVSSRSPERLIDHFLAEAGRLALSPNALFDEEYYCRRYPELRVAVERNRFRSGFDHFLRIGAKDGFSPTWFFDGQRYFRNNADLNDHSIGLAGYPDRYSHFLGNGLGEGRHACWMLPHLADVQRPAAEPKNLDQLLVTLGDAALTAAWVAPLFDASWFAAKYGTAGTVTTDLARYFVAVRTEVLSPGALFDEAFYRESNPDVMGQIHAGGNESGFEHFLMNGMHEHRRPFRSFDAEYYLGANRGVAEECRQQRLSAYQHFLMFGKNRRLPYHPGFAERRVAEEHGKTIFQRRAELLANSVTPSIAYHDEPDASIIIVSRDKYVETIQCISSIVNGTSRKLEIILYDNGSQDRIRTISESIPGIRVIRSETNDGFTVPVNEAAKLARGRFIILVNNDVELGPHAVDLAIKRLEEDSSVGVVGGKIVRTHGLLQEAGSVVWKDGSCLGYGRDMEPSDGRISFARDVDYCSGCFLAISRADWVQLGGFDPAYAPAYYEETDLCVRVWQLGKRVVYDPGIFLWHFEFGTSNHAEDVIALLQRNQKYFASKHRAFLSRCSAPSQLRIEAARLRHSRRPRILFIEDKIPDRMVGEGFPRSSKIASVLESIGGHLTVIGMHPSATLRDQWDRKGWSRSTEILPGVNHTNIDVFARERHQVYDFVWLSRTHNLVRLASWRQRNLEFFEGVRIILDTEAVASARIASQASLFGDEMDADQLLRDEFAGLELVDHVIAVNKLDEALIRKVAGERGLSPAFSVLGHALPQHDDLADFDAASGIVLPGSFGNLHGPNIDAVRWFDQAVRPLLSDRMKGLRFIIAGHRAKEFVDSAGLEGSYEVLSDLDDMSALFRGARLALASTRFAGGIPFKVHEAAGHGVPVVISKVLADQLGWSGDPRLAIAEGSTPEQFAELLERFYFNREAWTDCRDRQLERVRTECSEAAFERTIREIIGVKQVNGKPERVGPEKIRREPKRQPVLVKFG